MRTALSENGEAQYVLPIYDNLNLQGEIKLNELIGKQMRLAPTGDIRCVLHGEKLNKTFSNLFTNLQ